jgi:hypothetical protein
MEVESSILAFSALFPHELIRQEVDDPLVEVIAAQVGVAVGGFDLKDAVADLQDGDVKGAAPEIEHRDALVLLFVQAIGHGRGGGLVDDPEHLQPGDAAGVLGSLALGVAEVGRRGDHGLGHLFPQILLRGLLHLGEDHGRDLGGGIDLAPDVDVGVAVLGLDDLVGQNLQVPLHFRVAEFPADETFDGKHGI